jgi:translocation and assembly module TamA
MAGDWHWTPQLRWMPLACAALAASACATTPGPGEWVVQEIRIEGARQIHPDAIKKKILTTEAFWPWEVEIFDPNAWQADLRRIHRYYESEGYYQAQVVDEEVVQRPANPFWRRWAENTKWAAPGVVLRVKVSEGAPTRLAEVRIEGLASLTEAQRETLLESFPLKEGAIFREDPWIQVKPMLRNRLHEMGYAEAVVDGSVEVDVDARLARALIEVQPGERYRFGEIFVSPGARKVPRRWIIAEAARAIEKGAWYSDSALADAQARVFKMGVFGGVKVNRGPPNPEEGTIPVVVDVTEAPFRTLRAGGGVALDQTRNEARLLGEYTNRNLFGGLRGFTSQLRVGWAFLPSVVDVVSNNTAVRRRSEPLADLTAEFTQPRVLHPSLSYFVALEGEYRPELVYVLGGGQAKTGLAWTPHPSVTGRLTYNFEAYHFREGEALLGGRSTELAFGCPKTCLLSFVEAQVAWDRRMRGYPGGFRSDPVDPSAGHYLALSLQYGGGPLGGDYTYVRILPEGRLYRSFLDADRLTIAMRARAGTLISANAGSEITRSPIVSRFYAGGGASMRGYNNRRLSPLQLIPPDTPRRDPAGALIAPIGRQLGDLVPIGGDRLFEASIEARYRLNTQFTAAVFADAGFNNLAELENDITLRSAPEYFRTYMQYAVGVGLRYATLVGPIRLDFGYRLPWGTPPRVYETAPGPYLIPPPGGGCFGFWERQGGPTTNPEPRCTLHLSIGEAF